MISIVRCRFLIFLFAASPLLSSAQLEASVEVNQASIRIGEQLILKFSVKQDRFRKVIWPEVEKLITPDFELVERRSVDSSLASDKKSVIFTQEYVITAFDSGYKKIPAMPFLSIGGSDTLKTSSKELQVKVESVNVDDAKGFHDITGPADAPFSIREILPQLALFAAILIAGFGIFILWRWIRRKRKQRIRLEEPVPVVEVPTRPAHEFALEQLEELVRQRLWQTGNTKGYYSRLSEIIRVYIHYRFAIDASEMTTDEILTVMRITDIDTDSRNLLGQLLRQSDLVKFAKVQPTAAENETAVVWAFDFVNRTKIPDLEKPDQLA